MPIVESNAARATTQRATTNTATANTTATTAVGATGSGLDAVFAQMIAALEASTGLGLGSTTPTTGTATAGDTTSTDKSTDTKSTTNDKAATDLAGALAMMVQGTHVDLATTGGLASPASLGAQTSAVSATSAAKAGLDALQTAPATATVSTATATATDATAASTTTDAATLAATMAAATDGTAGSSAGDAKAQAAADAQANAAQSATDALGLQSLIARHTAPEKANGAGTPQVYGRPAARSAGAATDKTTAGDLTKLVGATHAARGLEDTGDAVTTDATTDAGKTTDGPAHAVVADIGAVASHGGDAPPPPPVDASAQTAQVGAIGAPGHHGTADATSTADRADTTPTVHAVPVSAVADTIATHARGGSSHFAIKLDPGELGSIDVRVEVKSSGEVRAHLIVERADTLDMMMRDQKTLERSLGNAGLDVGSSGLQFSLKDQGTGRGTPERQQMVADNAITVEEPTSVTPDLAAIAYRARRAGGLDLRI